MGLNRQVCRADKIYAKIRVYLIDLRQTCLLRDIPKSSMHKVDYTRLFALVVIPTRAAQKRQFIEW